MCTAVCCLSNVISYLFLNCKIKNEKVVSFVQKMEAQMNTLITHTEKEKSGKRIFFEFLILLILLLLVFAIVGNF